jgi:PAS domain-containing protein
LEVRFVAKSEKAGRKKYNAPTLTPITVMSLSPDARRVLAHLFSRPAPEVRGASPSDRGFRVVLDVEGKFKQVSPEFCAAVGYAQEELLGTRIDDITAKRTVHIPQHLGAVVYFGQFHCLWMFVHRNGHGVLVRSDWELLPSLSVEVFCELLVT